jgi:glycosyltransferase involved in cell wall biosynthesis
MLSVVIATEGRVSLLADLLKSIGAARETYTGETEVVVVDSSEAGEALEVMAECDKYGAVYVAGPENVREKRNMGIAVAIGDVVVFVDSDETVGPEFFAHHARAYEGSDVGGAVGPVEFVGDSSASWRAVAASRYLHPFSLALRSETPPWGPCANISYRRDALEAAGGFETNWPFRLGADDVDLSLRVRALGWRLVSVPAAVVFHSNSTWLPIRRTIARGFRWGRMHVYLSERHGPTVRDFPAGLGAALLVLSGVPILGLGLGFGYALLFGGLGLLVAAAPRGRGIWGIVAVPLDAVFDLGALYEVLITGRPVGAAFRRILYSSGQGVWREKALRRQLLLCTLGICVGLALGVAL